MAKHAAPIPVWHRLLIVCAALSARERAIEVGRDVAFAITLAVLAAGAVGFVTHAPSSDRMARTADTNRAL